MNKRPLVAFSACWIAGSSILSIAAGVEAAACYLGVVLGLAAWILFGKLSVRVGLACILALLLSGAERAWTDAKQASSWEAAAARTEETEGVVVGRLISLPDIDGDTVTFQLRGKAQEDLAGRVKQAKIVTEKLLIRVKLSAEPEQQAAAAWKRGAKVKITGEWQIPAHAGNFGAFDYHNYLERQGIRWVLSVRGAEQVELENSKVPWMARLLRLADDTRQSIGQLMDKLYSASNSGYMKGLVAGIQEDVDPGQYDDFSRLGLTHVLAISGLHVAVIVFLLLRGFSLLRMTRERALEFTIAAMPVYMVLTGASPSAIRACLMAMLALYLSRRNQLKDGLHLLAAAALIMVAWSPSVVEDVSFQLSFVVTAGLILYAPVMTDLLRLFIKRQSVRSALAVALTAQISSFPITVFYFHQLHLLSLIANLILVPFISFVVLPAGLASLVLGAIWLPLGLAPAWLAEQANSLTFVTTEWMGKAQGLLTVWPQPSLAWVCVSYGLLAAAGSWLRKVLDRRMEAAALRSLEQEQNYSYLQPDTNPNDFSNTVPLWGVELPPIHPKEAAQARRRAWLAAGSFVLAGSSWFLWAAQPSFLDNHAYVQFLDVGQGDSILIRTGDGRHVLFDTGGTVSFGKPQDAWRKRRDPYEVGRKTLVPLLKQRGIRHLDALVLTHLDADHIGGALALLSEIEVSRVLYNGTLKPTADVNRLFQKALQQHIPLYAVQDGMSWQLDSSAVFRVLYPESIEPGGTELVKEQNNRSVVIEALLYGRSFMLSGDLEAEGEAEIITSLANKTRGGAASLEIHNADVLKAGHHGSNTSSTADWLDWWNPKEIVISVGRHNLYGHPNPEALMRMEQSGASIWRTDLQGEVQYRISKDGNLNRRVKK